MLVGRGEADFAYVISQDKGYEAAMSALRARYADTFQEVALRPSIQSCLQAAFLLRSATLEELSASLTREYGPVQGALAYAHLQTLFAPPPAEEKPAAPRRRKRSSGKGGQTAQAPAVEAAPQEPAAEPDVPAEKTVKTTRTHRGGRRRKKPAEAPAG